VYQVPFQGFFLLQNSSRKTMKWKRIFLKGVMLFVIKGYLPLGIIDVATLLWPSVGVKPNTWKK
jgi:hypothetical protein